MYRHSRGSDAPARAPAVVVDAVPEMPRGGGGGDARHSHGKRKKKDEPSRETSREGDDAVDAMDAETAVTKTLGERARDAARTNDARRDARPSDADADAAIRDALGDASGSQPPRADSLATLLAQALAAEDRALIERCLSVGDAGVVSNTVARLPPSAVTKLLRAALDRMRSKPARSEGVARWMRAALLHHAAYIASSATAKTAVLELQQTVEAHQALQRPLQALLGRLDLLLHKQSEAKRARGGDGDDGDGDAEGPLSVYDEGDEDLEDVMEEGDEESDWETDGDDASGGEEEEEEEEGSDDDESDSE